MSEVNMFNLCVLFIEFIWMKNTLHKKFISFTFVFSIYLIFASRQTVSLTFLRFFHSCSSMH